MAPASFEMPEGSDYGFPVVDALAGKGLISSRPSGPGAETWSRPVSVDLTDGTHSELPFKGVARFLRAPLIRPSARKPLEPDPEATPESEPASVSQTGSGEWTIELTHPAWGRVRMIVSGRPDGAADWGPVSLRVVDASGAERFRYDNDLLISFWPVGVPVRSPYPGIYEPNGTDEGVTSPVDSTGAIYVHYNPGRYNGVIVLRPTDGEFEDFGTLPARDDYQGRFYSAHTVDTDGDGRFEVRSEINDCHPTCADATIRTEFWRLNGDDFVRVG